ncbi:MAG: hypothetical protein RLW62_06070 [Gammaproteobacteria bacterium]
MTTTTGRRATFVALMLLAGSAAGEVRVIAPDWIAETDVVDGQLGAEVAAGDFNGDGRPDILTSARNTGSGLALCHRSGRAQHGVRSCSLPPQ